MNKTRYLVFLGREMEGLEIMRFSIGMNSEPFLY